MTLVPASNGSALERIREAVVVVTIAILIGLTVYTLLGFAWTFKAAVESTQKLRHPFGTP
jgi:hypothetical protein